MPLINQALTEPDSMLRTGNGAGAYTAKRQQERNQQEPVSRSATPSRQPNATRSRRDSVASHNSGSNLSSASAEEERRRMMAQGMKLPVNSSIPFTKPANTGRLRTRSTDKISDLHNQHTQSLQNPQYPRTSTFEDTQDLSNWDDSSIPIQDDENQTAVFRGPELKPNRQEGWQLQKMENMIEQPRAARPLDLAGTNLISNSSVAAELKEARRLFALEQTEAAALPLSELGSRHNMLQALAQDAVQSDHEDYMPVVGALDTPSRPRSVPSYVRHAMHSHKNVAFEQQSPSLNSRVLAQENKDDYNIRDDSPELLNPSAQQPAYNRSKPFTVPSPDQTASQTVPMSRPAQTRKPVPPNRFNLSQRKSDQDARPVQSHAEQQTSMPIRSSFEPSRASDYPTSSEDDQQSFESRNQSPPPMDQQQPSVSRKRSREDDLDYSLDILKKKTYDELNSEQFDVDPRAPESQTTVDARGNTMTFEQRLSNLSKMQDNDQKAMFQSQTDEEWAQTGSWFIERFQEDLKKLMNKRLERRKISMRYEDEMRRRQKTVECSAAGLDDELRELKNGGGKLIEGKRSTSKVDTPRK